MEAIRESGAHLARKRAFKPTLGALVVLAATVALGVRCDHRAAEVEARWVEPPSTFALVDGMRAHYRDRGSGPAVVLLHGSNASLHTWEGWALSLARDHRVITVDLPGHGLTGPDPRGRYSAVEMAAFVDAFVTHLGLNKFALGGNSMGGGVSWRYALLHPEKVEQLILVDSAGIQRTEPLPLGPRLYSLPVTGHVARWLTPKFMIRKSVRDVYGDPSLVTEAKVNLYDDMLLRDGNREATRRRLSTGDHDDLVARLGEIRVPTLILWGGRDVWIPLAYGDELRKRIPGAKLVVFPELGHVPMEEDPAGTGRVVREFLAGR